MQLLMCRMNLRAIIVIAMLASVCFVCACSDDAASSRRGASADDAGVSVPDSGDVSSDSDALDVVDARINVDADASVDTGSDVDVDASVDVRADVDAAGRDTSSSVQRCAANEHVVAHGCEACAAGRNNKAGDDPSGPDTSCDDDACDAVFDVACDEFAEAYVKASNTDAGDDFGQSIALDGDTLVVSAYQESSDAVGIGGAQDNNNAISSGAVYVFVRSGSTWTQQAYIKASNADKVDLFGRAVGLDGDTLVVSAHGEASAAAGVDGDQTDNSLRNAGAVYVFERSGSTWSQTAYIKASNPGENDYFGIDLALDGDTLAVGAREDSDATGINGDQSNDDAPDSGAVYVFVRSAHTWTQQAYLKASNTGAGDYFGDALALNADTLVVGAPREASGGRGVGADQSNDNAERSGAAYVFTRSGTTWTQQAYLKASNTTIGDEFGGAVALDGDTLAVGAANEFSAAVGVDGDQTDTNAPFAGAVYLFHRSARGWAQEAYIKASNTDAFDRFGTSVALHGDRLAVGAIGERSDAIGVDGDQLDNSIGQAGAIYLFARSAGSWSQLAYVKSSNTDNADYFGWEVALTDKLLAVSAYHESSNADGVNGDQSDDSAYGAGAVYVDKIAASTN